MLIQIQQIHVFGKSKGLFDVVCNMFFDLFVVPRWERHQARSIAVETALEGLADIARSTELDPQRLQSIRDRLHKSRENIHSDLRQVLEDHPELAAEQVRGVLIRLLHRQRTAVEQAYREGLLSEEALREVQEEIDLLLMQEIPDPIPGSLNGQTDE